MTSPAPTRTAASARTAGARAWPWPTSSSSRNHSLAFYRKGEDRPIRTKARPGSRRRRPLGRGLLGHREFPGGGYPDRPSLFGDDPAARALTRYYSSLADGLGGGDFPFVALDIWRMSPTRIATIFGKSREARRQDARSLCRRSRRRVCPHFARASLRCAYPEGQPFLGGDGLSMPTMPSSVRSNGRDASVRLPLLEEDDPVRLWRDRLLDCFDGLARRPPTTPEFDVALVPTKMRFRCP